MSRDAEMQQAFAMTVAVHQKILWVQRGIGREPPPEAKASFLGHRLHRIRKSTVRAQPETVVFTKIV